LQLWQALILGVLQGVSELFPISSLGHAVLLPALLAWTVTDGTAVINSKVVQCTVANPCAFTAYEGQDKYLAFLVALHLATAIALLVFFWRDWLQVVSSLVGSVQRRQLVYDRPSKFAWLLVAGTIPVGIIGLVLESKVRDLIGNPVVVAGFLFLNGLLMLLGEYLRRRAVNSAAAPDVVAVGAGGSVYNRSNQENLGGSDLKVTEDLTFVEGATVGVAQALALLPGISRSGATMVAGLFFKLTHEEAARFAFMLATPVIGLAALLKVPSLFSKTNSDILGMAVLAAIVSGLCAFFSVRFLMRYFETKRLDSFGYYSLVAGLVALVVLVIRG
jgi:undecaprenyl-diphosphatase